MLLRIASDLHNEGYLAVIPALPTDSETILILAGDICEFKTPSSFNEFFGHIKGRFKQILYVPGNHEYYRGSLTCGVESFYKRLKHNIPELVILDNQCITIDGIKFVGTTLWADFDNYSPVCMYDAETMMNDYKMIRYGPKSAPYARKIRAATIAATHMRAKEFLLANCEKDSVVITHHAPTRLSVADHFKNDRLNGAYVSNLEDIIFDKQPKLWIHGHMHDSCEYTLDNTAVICNPRGYCQHVNSRNIPKLLEAKDKDMELYRDCFADQNSAFDPYLLVEI